MGRTKPRVAAGALAVILIACGAFSPGPARAATAAVAEPTLSIPPAGLHGHPLFDSWFDLKPYGYQQAEYFVSGTATDATTGKTAPYTTRIIVTRPVDPSRFNGTVMLDWVNVTAQFENAVDTDEAMQMLLREGFAFVHVSAQSAGICCTPLTPKVWDPVRYAALSHPGDAYAYDMFSQVAKAIRTPGNTIDPMKGLRVQKVLAAGQSQSASELYNYVANIQPTARVIDGFLIHGLIGDKNFKTPPSAPVLLLLSDNEASPVSPNTDVNYRLWEIAGTAHSDFWLGYNQVFGQGPRTLDDAPQQSPSGAAAVTQVAGDYGEQPHPMMATCVLAGATMPMHYATSSAIHQLDQWVKTGTAPKNGPRFAFANGQLAKDSFGNTLGGIRMPPIDVPVATYLSTACPLGGLTVPFSDVQLHLLYPTHADYYAKMQAATDAAVKAGWLLPADAVDLMSRACAAKNRWQGVSTTGCTS